MPVLRTGAVPVKDAGPMEATVISHHVGKDLETLRLDLVAQDCETGYGGDPAITVELGPDRGRGPGVIRQQTGAVPHLDVLVARPRDQAGQPIAGDAWFRPSTCQVAGVHHAFRAATTAAASDPQLPLAWASELAQQFGNTRGDAWHAFARNRMLRIAGHDAEGRPRQIAPDPDRIERLMALTTGVDALQEGLQSDRGLLAGTQQAGPTIAIGTVHGPELSPHPWAEMQKALGRAAPAEPLAAEVPAEFYYVRFASLSALFRVLDQADAWATPIVTLMDGRSEYRGLAERYQTQLGLERGELARAFGDQVVTDLAAVGSDPYFGEGTDITMLFRVKSRPLFEATLAAALRKHGAAHGGIATSALAYQGTTIAVARAADGAVHQYRAQLGAIEVVSNSLAAIQRVLDTHGGRHPSLLSEPDFQYALARGAGVPADVLAFIGDRFVAAVVGPAQKILEARRQVALAELSTPAYAELLYGWIYGQRPRSTDELVAAGLLGKDELAHHGGAAIAWRPGDAPRSSWGTPGALTPLIDLPAVETVTEVERDAYGRFSATYQGYWRSYIDPIAIRIAITRDALTVDTRVLPLIDASEYRELAGVVGQARVAAPPIATGARAVFGLGDRAKTEATGELRSVMRGLPDLAWLGDWVALGVEDRTQVAAAILAEREVPQGPDPDVYGAGRHRDRDVLTHLPAYAAVGIRDRAAAALFIVGLRKLAEEAVPGVLAWGEVSRTHDVAIVRIAAKDDSLDGITLYYAFARDALVVSLDEHTIRRQVEALVAGGAPAAPEAPQLVLDAAGAPEGPLWRAAAWLLEGPARKAADRALPTAEALLRGAPDAAASPARARELALGIFGAVPLTADGRAFELGPEGVRDPVRGNRFAPAWPALPVPGSPAARLLAAISRARCEIGFDAEPGGKQAETSLHLRLTLATRQ